MGIANDMSSQAFANFPPVDLTKLEQQLFADSDENQKPKSVLLKGNYAVVCGTSPPNLDQTVISRVTKMMHERQDRLHSFLQFPTVLDQIVRTDDRLNIAKSDQAQKLKLYHKSSFYWFYRRNGRNFDSQGNFMIEDVDKQSAELKKQLLRIDGQGSFKEAPSQWEGEP